MVAECGWEAVGAFAGVEFQLVVEVGGVGGVVLAGGIWIRQKGVAREWFYRESVGGVEVEVFFEAIGVEEIVADPSCGERRQFSRIEIQL